MIKVSKGSISKTVIGEQVLAGESCLSEDHFAKLTSKEGSEKALFDKLKVSNDDRKEVSKLEA